MGGVNITVPEAGPGGLVDLRLVQKPVKLTDKEAWSTWRFVFENYMSCVDGDFHVEMATAAQSATPIRVADDWPKARRNRARILYAILAGILEKVELLHLSLVVDRNSFEA